MNFHSTNPATGDLVWSGTAAGAEEVASAVARARAASPAWSGRPLVERIELVRAYATRLSARKTELAAMISREVGKPGWEALTEVQSMIGKVEFSIEAHRCRCSDFTGGPAIARFRPHGVVAVFGPFNFPGHLPNGHLVPALLAGNTALFKPSEYAPAVAELTRACWLEAGLPPDCLQVIHGTRSTGEALAAHPGIDGLFFTGGSVAGAALSVQFARTPGKILALELGGNNPLVVWHPRDVPAAALLVLQSAFLSAGQRCTCARRLILPADAAGDALLAALTALVARVRVGPCTDQPEPFHGPVISAAAAARVLAAQRSLLNSGAKAIVPVTSPSPASAFLRPGILDVTSVANRADEEIFGPLLQVIRVPDFDAAILEANRTRFGLAAGLVTDDAARFARFREEVRAGIINWNQALTGASGAVPFGGIGASGNHRPSGFFAADYCSYVVAGIETPELKPSAQLPPGLDP